MENLPNMVELQNIAEGVQNWALKYLLTWEALQQLMVLVFMLVASWVAARKIAGWMQSRTGIWHGRHMIFVSSRVHLSAREILSVIITPLLLWTSAMIAAAANWPSIILNGAATLATAWAVIRLSSSIIRSSFWSKTIALTMLVVAALSIFGWLHPTIEVLDKAAIKLGNHSISLLFVIKGGIILAILLWLVSVANDGLQRALWRSQGLSPSQKVLFGKLGKVIFIALAIIFGLNFVGIDFTALAVFSGALGIGIGFGLQKVFANLISGFILLMDKSIKPGDVIAINDTYGWVNQISARYVSILTRDGKEHLIPNEKLITEPVENWSYSNENIRVHVPIGVSYNSDRKLVKRLLLEIAQNNPRILKTPEPACLIKSFGDSAVDFELRVWIHDPVNGIANVRSSVYEAIWDAFKDNNIEIPFPQRDINLKADQVEKLLRAMYSTMPKI